MNEKVPVKDLSLSEKLLYTTVRIESRDSRGQLSTGTGFYYTFVAEDKKQIPVIVTNKHVVAGGVEGSFIVNLADTEGSLIVGMREKIHMDNFENRWIMHPQNVDLCMMKLEPIMFALESQGKILSMVSINENLTATEENLRDIPGIEQITMVGYPNGLWDEINNFPIARRGITATNPLYDYNGKEEFLIDAACFPGSSGSPVFIMNEGSYSNRKGELYLGNRILFLGVLYAGPQFMASGEIRVVDVPTTQRPVAFSNIPLNLGIIIKAKKLFDFRGLLGL